MPLKPPPISNTPQSFRERLETLHSTGLPIEQLEMIARAGFFQTKPPRDGEVTVRCSCGLFVSFDPPNLPIEIVSHTH